ncbi:Aldo-ket-red domain-containing protein [Mycena chlorophos]|uniref:Aldo-ket-red domain-containing protein n=1 Tax=Mycena chlorophos TaxID=658473 RepID=A0A8H6WM53_MYCCL|nr:Aldo-ket-red domain-containing protein [Mycena chlorophos]
MAEHPEFAAKSMPFRRLGPSGLRVPLFSVGGWLTLGGSVVGDPVKDIMRTAFENGINMFDTAEDYQKGEAEREMGRVIKELNWRRSDIVISTKIFWSHQPGTGPNDTGLSRKHIIEGTKACLERLQLDYVDVIFAHRYDISVPMEEIVRAFNYVIDQGWAFYYGTSEWPAERIEEAHHVAARLGLIAPIAEQCKHNMFHRERPENSLYAKYGLGTTAFSALAGGLLTGKYNDGIPAGSRFATVDYFVGSTETNEGQVLVAKVRDLSNIAKARQELNTTPTALALAWVAKHKSTSTVILGVTSSAQLLDNLKALEVLPKLDQTVMEKIETILGNEPEDPPTYGRPSLDVHGRQYLY